MTIRPSRRTFYVNMHYFTALFAVVTSALISLSLPGHSADATIRFNRDIRPMFSDNCYACHGADAKARKAELRLDEKAGLFDNRDGERVVVPGKPDESLLIEVINAKDEDELMPPPKSHKKLTPEQKVLFRRWIEQGAHWESHWSFTPPIAQNPPEVRDAKWARNEIDRFILSELEKKELRPAPEADRATLIRRASLDITGLPPTPEEVVAFTTDASPKAFEALVDRLFQSPRAGEHRARYWLDAARYGDTHGMHFDNYREIWMYRDWVIEAFNKNMPFDQFTIEQLAGDLLPNRTQSQQIATGFHRCSITTNEGGTIDAENQANLDKDRVEVTSTVWLGLTMQCASCHDHKFDPLTMRDFYQMAAFFRNNLQSPRDGNVKNSPPVLVVPEPKDARRWEELPGLIDAAAAKIAEHEKKSGPLADAWISKARPEDFEKGVSPTGLELWLPLLDDKRAAGIPAKLPNDIPEGFAWKTDEKFGGYLQTADDKSLEVGPIGNVDATQGFSVGAWVRGGDPKKTAALIARMDDAAQYRGWDLLVDGGKLSAHLVSSWSGSAIKVSTKKQVLKKDQWTHVCVTYDGSGKAAGFDIYINGESVPLETNNNNLKRGDSTLTATPTRIGSRSTSHYASGYGFQDVRWYRRTLSAGEAKIWARAREMKALLASEPGKGEREQKLRRYYLETKDTVYPTLVAAKQALEKERDAIKGRSPVTFVMEEKAGPAKANILFRGQYDQPKEEVEAGVPAALHKMPADAPKNRLGLAKWIMAPDNPLTARVTVNRMWQEIFGNGLVRSAGDFGVMGENPSHPALLDWLAVEFQKSGWDMRHIYRLIITSATYRQAAVTTPSKLELDPQNTLLSRGPRFRMDAEVLRDSALAASGLLVGTIGGPSVKSYQPEGVWEAVGMPESNTRKYKADSGEGLYRRSMYWFWKRMAPPASLETFNAPNRETCTVRRERTNTPLQALVTLNDVQFFEAARNLAEAALKHPGATQDSKLDFIAMRALSRPFRPEERKVMAGALASHLSHYQTAMDDAKKVISVGESKADATLPPPVLAAWTLTASQVLNLDEFVTK